MRFRIARALPWLLGGLCLAAGVHAGEADHIHVSQAWIRLLPGDLPAGAYATLENDGDQPASLKGASSTSYASAMLHQSSHEGGVNRMAMVDSMAIPAHGKAALAPGGYHLMLMRAAAPVKAGDTVKVTLQFGDGSTLDANFLARPANATDAGAEHAH
jgi:copper(I)-binding protein